VDDAGVYRLLADSVLLVHFAFVAFVVTGFLLILIGLVANWRWVRNRTFRIAHLCAIGVVVAQAWLGKICPLTIWENELRRRAGQDAYAETFVQHWLHELLFYDAEPWVFTAIYTVFGAVVLLVWWLTVRTSKRS
jgi:multisubunit Na+/H+ antiporter MnhB subunit